MESLRLFGDGYTETDGPHADVLAFNFFRSKKTVFSTSLHPLQCKHMPNDVIGRSQVYIFVALSILN